MKTNKKNQLLAILGGKSVMAKPTAPYSSLGKKETKAAIAVLQAGTISGFIGRAGPFFLGGKYVKRFEDELKRRFKIKYAVSFNSATTALQGALGAIGIGPGDEVITTPFTMSATASAIVMQNAVPVFADIEKDTFCIDPVSVEKKITPKTKAILAVNLFGRAAKLSALKKIAKKHGLYLVADPGGCGSGGHALEKLDADRGGQGPDECADL